MKHEFDPRKLNKLRKPKQEIKPEWRPQDQKKLFEETPDEFRKEKNKILEDLANHIIENKNVADEELRRLLRRVGVEIDACEPPREDMNDKSRTGVMVDTKIPEGMTEDDLRKRQGELLHVFEEVQDAINILYTNNTSPVIHPWEDKASLN